MFFLCLYVSVRVFVRDDARPQVSTDRKVLLVKLSARVPAMCVKLLLWTRDEFMCRIRERHSYVCPVCYNYFCFLRLFQLLGALVISQLRYERNVCIRNCIIRL